MAQQRIDIFLYGIDDHVLMILCTFYQVDFLNEQLAMREAQLVETADKILRAESVHMEVLSK